MPQTYTVKKGETLSGISQKLLGDASRWEELGGYTGKPEDLPIGTVLTIPGAGAEVTCPPGYRSDPITKACVPITEPGVTPTPTPTPAPTLESIATGVQGVATQVSTITQQTQQLIQDAANAANDAAQTIFDNIPEGDDVDMRDSTKIISDIMAGLDVGEAPTPPDRKSVV